METSKNQQLLGQIALNLILALTLVQSSLANVVDRDTSGSRTLLSDVLQVFQYEPPPRGKPEDTDDAGSRGSCDFLAIVPNKKYGLTASEYPTFWFYLKRQPAAVKSVKLELQDETKTLIYKNTFQLTQAAGILNVRLPKTAPPLTIGQKYRWVLSYDEMNNEMYTSGQIKRVALEPELESQLLQATPRERLHLLAKQRLWYDLFTQLAQLHRATPQDTEIDGVWSGLLNLTFRNLNCQSGFTSHSQSE